MLKKYRKTLMQYLFLFLISLIGGAIQSATGFGYAMIAMPLFALIIPIKYSIIVLAITSFVLIFNILFRLKFKIIWKLALPMMIFILIGQFIGTQLLFFLDSPVLNSILGVVLIIISLILIFLKTKLKIKINKISTISFGLMSGLLGGMFGISGPPLVIYYIAALEDKEEYQSTLQMSLLTVCVSTLVLHTIYGNINFEVIKYSISGIIGIIIGSAIGIYIFKRIKKETLTKPICLLIFLMGCGMIAKELIN